MRRKGGHIEAVGTGHGLAPGADAAKVIVASGAQSLDRAGIAARVCTNELAEMAGNGLAGGADSGLRLLVRGNWFGDDFIDDAKPG